MKLDKKNAGCVIRHIQEDRLGLAAVVPDFFRHRVAFAHIQIADKNFGSGGAKL